MSIIYQIHPSIGIARLGNSPSEFYLAPTKIGGRPLECNSFGDEILVENEPVYVKKFKDKKKLVKRQATKFKIFKHDSDDPNSVPTEIDLANDPNIKKITWRVHLANKKSSWYDFDYFMGDLLIGEDNDYKSHNAKLRNPDVESEKRSQLITDFGYRELSTSRDSKLFKYDDVSTTAPKDYPQTLPLHQLNSEPAIGNAVTFLGEMKTDSKSNLVVLGGYGHAGGNEPYATFAGGDEWYDDISDGPVLCELTLADDSVVTLDAWIIVGPPKFAPELVNITTLYDTIFDVAVRHQKAIPEIFNENEQWNENFIVNYDRDILPIIERIGHYRWVANIPSMTNFSNPPFDLKDNSTNNKKNRETFFNYFRKSPDDETGSGGAAQTLFSSHKNSDKEGFLDGIPLMPMGSGSNSGNNRILDKFVTLSRTQYFFLKQWAEGKFTTTESPDFLDMVPLDHADIGNCVGAPMCPGVEVTWSVRNPAIYASPFRIKHKTKDLTDYLKNGLDPNHEETSPLGMPGLGCEPGDLTKRMAIPWMSDLFECNVQHINFTRDDRTISPVTKLEAPPTYYAYWWPPQSPWDVILGVTDPDETDPIKREKAIVDEIAASGVSAGQQVNYIRGINSHMQMVKNWWHLGFILNQNEDENREEYPYFVEKERNHEAFEVVSLSVGNRVNLVDPGSTRFVPGFYLKNDDGEY